MADQTQQPWKSDAKWAIALLFFAVLGLSGWTFDTWDCPVGPQDASTDATCARTSPTGPGQENLLYLTDTLLDDSAGGTAEDRVSDGSPGQVVALEALAVLLVAALIGAIVIAVKEPEFEGSDH